ncbi:DUF2946 family protein [Paraburkholderia sabiae]|jgi:hypothetical protein|uniref:DUF2946 family protein n=1 Tax=Paraburkholderia sabiae TaxID=273251 RepID=A0ABU9QDY8_9BURK|nr:DUF2946 family protein [Paraburkholderia sabiae]WJZ74683.1 DUF2946 family protein [Paraburkholderia sabiae]CAD6540056.1 hypothetical protein LMG24235_03490 [Paraburkholderia sabiae]CAG9198551.1 conserved hypothetical protein [Paraburkholderia sabiae]
MDDIVKQALAKWPNVPHCTGWLLLDRRGNWRMRDDAAQAAGAPGEPIRHTALLGFINRNYEADDAGQWFFQNGPQRVYVELGYTPFVVRLAVDDASGQLTLTDQAGSAFEPSAVYLDDEGGILFTDRSTPARVAVLHDHDLDLFSEHADLASDGRSGEFRWRDGVALNLEPVRKSEVEKRFGFIASPAARAAASSDNASH